jgi:D-alanyl-D-alanine carboxypeptidase (penicillin-binding protein 5/6)
MRRALVAFVALVAVSAAPVRASTVDSTPNAPASRVDASAGYLAGEDAAPRIDASAWYLVGEDGEPLAQRNSREPRPIASITKLMTALVVLERAQLSDVVTVTPYRAGRLESTVYLRPGEELTVAELMRAMLVPSANDAAHMLALHVGDGSIERFVELMNAEARELGLVDTHFQNPHGLDEPGHVSSAQDATTLVRHALGVPFVRDALARTTFQRGSRVFPTTDDLLASWAPLLGGKTGHTEAAGWSEAAAARRGGATVYGAVLGSPTRARRNEALRELLSYGLSRYGRIQAIDSTRVYASAVTGYGRPAVELVARRAAARTILVGTPLLERVVAPSSVLLPVRKGQSLGRVEILEGGRVIASSELVAAEAVSEPGLLAKALWLASETADNAWEIVS